MLTKSLNTMCLSQSSLMFVSPNLLRRLSLLTNSGLARRNVLGTNTQAYFVLSSVSTKNANKLECLFLLSLLMLVSCLQVIPGAYPIAATLWVSLFLYSKM
jgi:hypothetical protein